MKILNMGSLNLDYTYSVSHFVNASETISSTGRSEHCGGKGLNQSVALARAGANIFHAGHVGQEGKSLIEMLQKCGVDTTLTTALSTPTGHAIIQVTPQGQNCIIIFGGANQMITTEDVDKYLSYFDVGDMLLVQNETSCVEYAIEKAYQKGMLVALNPSPITEQLIKSNSLQYVHWLILNRIEGYALTSENDPEKICRKLNDKYPKSVVVLTLGSEGCIYYDGISVIHHKAYKVNAVDTTGAGDTFTGYFLSAIAADVDIEKALELASKAAAIAIESLGASTSIPDMDTVLNANLI